jgi:nucleotide-binding universal stress UspA family protein
MTKILVPTDFSPSANKALNFAVQIAKQAKAQIILFHACPELFVTNTTIDPTLYPTNMMIDATLYPDYNQTTVERAKEQLSLLKKSIEDTEGVSVETQVYQGAVENTIVQASEDLDADLVVMGTLGDTGLKEKIFGSVTAGVIGKTNTPVLTVPLLSEWNPPRKILLAVNDFSQRTEVVNSVFDLAKMFNASVHIAFFTELYSENEDVTPEQMENILLYEEKLQTRHPDTVVRAFHLKGHLFQDTIEDYLEKQNFDIVAMVTHKRGFLESVFHSSMTKRMSYYSNVPLLAIPEKAVKLSATV